MESNSTATKKQTISILGCGWYGLALAKRLVAEGYTVKGSSTSPEKMEILSSLGILPYLLNFQEEETANDPDFFKTDILVIAIPPKRSSAEQSTFLGKVQKIAALAQEQQIPQVIFISSTAVYGECNSEITASSTPMPDTASGKAMLETEQFLASLSFNTTILRFAGLIGPGRNPGRFFAGKQDIPNGQAPVNLLHQEDCVAFTLSLIEQAAFGVIYNVCSPDHPSRQAFYVKAAEQSKLPLPSFIDELLNWKIISGEPVHSSFNYQYRIADFSKWMDTHSL
ncbi:SDR family oxidoreductase [Pedobacter gandavensis]|uniref:NAD(P)H-binding protein n=1 Tax=Pedobacter gandavensis TaxID=2679963 RepID=A0ABR6ET42_9SPHI|nr:SDR family oxidoreductase [Pedobacter gandavensis]MBB2148431.1 NAD(P)H-binding protein [Pedobacter gandavensis]